MKKVGIIGASGMAGRAVYKLVTNNSQLEPTGIIRNEDKARKVLGNNANLLIGDALAMDNEELTRFDVLVDALGTTSAQADQQIELAKKLIEVARQSKARVIFILGAGSLKTGEDHHLFVKDLEKLPNAESWVNTPRQQLKELQFLKTINDVDWLGISPSANFTAGPATNYILGKDELLKNKAGESKTNSGTMAEVIVSEIVEPVHHKQRITVANE
ncbi:NAD(P)-dependent oxidoreductase [Lactobacillus ultunensis]|uniref:Semialdehyde dehydrogenase, NAD binding domain protein n=1 Tax=Lactobacillus ultunensis DSM 16047 TaxID=525365 RepID=C2ENB3_9LACO|nr:NAD(P)H-binding protein [Lactobacillus ultunensis]EEJ71917.1 semialdehyde dehydrogenase, NAD binding domain protein [Lactobacillus ultunensis DSM 16047]KRL82085.1 FMN reductase [Lactobacillus ultunensis DSM 16047]QQP27668.1 NAD(P)H-binding protein [Lactobacillus ultunensis]